MMRNAQGYELTNVNCIIMDLDGVIANHERRIIHAPDWDKVYQDMENDHLYPEMSIVWRKWCSILPIFVFTGRPEKYRKLTKDWLDMHNLEYAKIWLRPDKNFETSARLKEAWMMWVMKEGMNPVLAYEDDPKVAELYVKMGVPTHLVMRKQNGRG